MKALITGVTGFVGKYLAEYLIKEGYEVLGTTRNNPPVVFNSLCKIITLDLNSSDQILDFINQTQPDYIFHLAGQSSVKYSWDNKTETFEANIIMTNNLLEAVRRSSIARHVKIMTVGSSEEYGDVYTNEIPIKEDNHLRPISPYGISKATVSMLAQHYHRAYSLNIIHVRPFNHIGPGQSLGFVTTDFATQVAQIEANQIAAVIKVGNLNSKRDFTDVRDIVKAYSMLIIVGKSGEVYNICSSEPREISYILDYFVSNSHVPIKIQKNEDLLRKIDFPIYIGSNEKVKNEINWDISISLTSSLNDILEYCRDNVNNKGSRDK